MAQVTMQSPASHVHSDPGEAGGADIMSWVSCPGYRFRSKAVLSHRSPQVTGMQARQ